MANFPKFVRVMELIKKAFEELEVIELFALYKLRTEVFVVEQNCAYQEVDDHDRISTHIFIKEDREIIACARVCPPGSVYRQPSIGRMAVAKAHRGKGLARKLFTEALDLAIRKNVEHRVKIQAQCYLEEFYKTFGFRAVSEPYPDSGIMHVDMILEKDSDYSS